MATIAFFTEASPDFFHYCIWSTRGGDGKICSKVLTIAALTDRKEVQFRTNSSCPCSFPRTDQPMKTALLWVAAVRQSLSRFRLVRCSLRNGSAFTGPSRTYKSTSSRVWTTPSSARTEGKETLKQCLNVLIEWLNWGLWPNQNCVGIVTMRQIKRHWWA